MLFNQTKQDATFRESSLSRNYEQHKNKQITYLSVASLILADGSGWQGLQLTRLWIACNKTTHPTSHLELFVFVLVFVLSFIFKSLSVFDLVSLDEGGRLLGLLDWLLDPRPLGLMGSKRLLTQLDKSDRCLSSTSWLPPHSNRWTPEHNSHCIHLFNLIEKNNNFFWTLAIASTFSLKAVLRNSQTCK